MVVVLQPVQDSCVIPKLVAPDTEIDRPVARSLATLVAMLRAVAHGTPRASSPTTLSPRLACDPGENESPRVPQAARPAAAPA